MSYKKKERAFEARWIPCRALLVIKGDSRISLFQCAV